MNLKSALIAAALAVTVTQSVGASEITVLTAGAFKQVLLAVVPEYEKQTGNTVKVENDTVGALVKRIQGGTAFDVVIVSPAAIGGLAKDGKVLADSQTNLARVGVGVVVKEGAPLPDISSVETFKRTLIAAKSVAYIDPASGGSSGIFVDKLLDRLGVASEIRPKAKLIPGGAVAEHIANGEAEVGIHQISEILPVKGVTLVGPLPPEIQNYTVYAAGVSADSKLVDAAKALVRLLSGADGAAVLKSKGMEPAGS
ncbi:MAG: substrate-binding domain-containing protein [Bradyrhizobiaceae bacterium]|nr:substrate-binding domain-containing protein [Bradyrhizobiaceae bacterium]